MTIYLIYDETQTTENTELAKLLNSSTIQSIPYHPQNIPGWPKESRVLLFLSDDHLRSLLPQLLPFEWHLSFLPHPKSPCACKAYGISPKFPEALEEATEGKPVSLDLVLCENQVVFQSLIIGDVFGLRPGGMNDGGIKQRFLDFKKSFSKLFKLVPKRFEIKTQKEKKIVTAALGMTVVEHGNHSILGKNLLPKPKIADGKFHTFILAPHSWISVVNLLLRAFFRVSQSSLPRCAGTLESGKLNIECQQGFEYRLDQVEACSRSLTVRCPESPILIIPGRKHILDKASPDNKERLKTHYLPTGEESILALTSSPLNMIAHASEEEFRDLYQTLKESASTSTLFVNFMILSTMLASVGLLSNSAPVIIGAMILAPLMGPIISLAMAMLRWDINLLKSSASTLSIGLVLALVFAVIMGQLVPESSTPEIIARIRPNILDLAVAVISGIAGGYASARASAAKSLAGVSIAVALVPPLAVTGLGISWWQIPLMQGAFLLFFTNLAGIILASAITFWVLGFAPFKRAKQGLFISAIFVGLVSIPLFTSFDNMVIGRRIEQILEIQNSPLCQTNQIKDVKVSGVDPMTVFVQIKSYRPLLPEDYQCIEKQIMQRLDTVPRKNRDIHIEMQSSLVLSIPNS